MTLQQLRYAVHIADCGSITEAAQTLFLAQPSLSASVRDLEKELGFSMFTRTNRGIQTTPDGADFLGYARQVLQQMDLLEERYLQEHRTKQRFCVSCQHYAFTANAFVDLIKEFGGDEYDFTLRETTTAAIIEDVKNARSEMGVLYLSHFNEQVLIKLIKESNLLFHPLFTVQPHVFLSRHHPLASKDFLSLEELEEYPCLSFEQGENNSFYFSEEVLSTWHHKKKIQVSDRAAIINLLIGVNAYTIATGVFPSFLHGERIISVPLQCDEHMQVGVVVRKDYLPSRLGSIYWEALRRIAAVVEKEQQL